MMERVMMERVMMERVMMERVMMEKVTERIEGLEKHNIIRRCICLRLIWGIDHEEDFGFYRADAGPPSGWSRR